MFYTDIHIVKTKKICKYKAFSLEIWYVALPSGPHLNFSKYGSSAKNGSPCGVTRGVISFQLLPLYLKL